MNTQIILAAVVGLIIGAGGVMVFTKSEEPKPVATSHMMQTGEVMSDDLTGMHSAMSDMMAGLEGKTGDEFDKAFLTGMILHHEGAVVMAEAALKNAKHAEIKEMANAIISAQTTEIKQMQDWQKSWYGGE